jgi:protein-S-isoprenylcysteine O-methyltransferase Ste14
MKKSILVFLVVVTPILAASLAFLGLKTLRSNPMGWFLLTVGVVYSTGLIVSLLVNRRKFWESASKEEVQREERNDRSFWLITIGMSAVFFVSPVEYLYFRLITVGGQWPPFFGLGLVITGTWLFVWARRTLKHAYSGHLEVKEKQPLVQTGPYRIICHPAYASFLLMGLGLAIGYISLLGFLAYIILLIPGMIFRIRVEERLLMDSFGEEYRSYRSKTSRILPFIL